MSHPFMKKKYQSLFNQTYKKSENDGIIKKGFARWCKALLLILTKGVMAFAGKGS